MENALWPLLAQLSLGCCGRRVTEVMLLTHRDLPLASAGAPDPPHYGRGTATLKGSLPSSAASAALQAVHQGLQEEDELTVLVNKAVLIPVEIYRQSCLRKDEKLMGTFSFWLAHMPF